MRLTLRQLQIFLAVADSGSTTAAADAIALSQSATSAALNELEETLNIQLFDRVGKRLVLNDSGRLLLPQARHLLDAAAGIEQQFAAVGDQGGGGLHIGASTTIGIYLLPAILAAGIGRNAESRPQVMIANTAEVAAAVANFEVDFGLVEGPCHQPDVLAEPWLRDELIIVCAPDHPILAGGAKRKVPVKALRAAGWLMREPGSGTRAAVEHALLPYLLRLRSNGEFSNSEAIKHAAAQGLGLACLSRLVVQDMIAMGRLVELVTTLPRLERNFYLVLREHKMLSARLRHFLDFCKAWSDQALPAQAPESPARAGNAA